jgi:dolichol-phosphate mannosyltransferase
VVNHSLVILPTYNESANIEEVLTALIQVDADIDILVVDDNSPDGTGQIVDRLATPQIHVLHRPRKAGLGPAYLAGFLWALDRGYRHVIEMDADGSHHANELPALLAAASAGADLVIGSRWIPGGSVQNWPLIRRFISRFGTWYAAAVLKLPYKDLTSGFRVLSRDLADLILKTEIKSSGYGFQIEIVALAQQHGMSIVQVPITFTERQRGQSKMSKAIVLEAWLWTTQSGFKRILNRR